MRTVRHAHLAHRQIEPTAAGGPGLTDKDVEGFYQDNSKIIGLLLSRPAAGCACHGDGPPTRNTGIEDASTLSDANIGGTYSGKGYNPELLTVTTLDRYSFRFFNRISVPEQLRPR